MQRRKKLLIIVFLSLLVIAGLMIPIMAQEAPSESTDKTETTEMPDNTTDASYVEGDVDSMPKDSSLGTFNPTQPPKPAETSEAKPTPESMDVPESEPTPTPPPTPTPTQEPTPTSEPTATPEPTLTPDEDDGEHSVGNSDDNYEETSQPEEINQADEDEQTDEIIGEEESRAEEETVEPADFSFGRIWANNSGIIAEVRGNGIQAEDQVEATLDNSTLTVADYTPYDREQHSSRIYILMDLSGYDSRELSAFKESVYSFIQTVGDNDTVVLIALIVIFLATFIVLMLSIQRPSSGKTANPPAKAGKKKDDSAPAVKDEYRVRLRITSMNTMPREQEVRVVLNEPVYVGRDPGCAICVPDAKLSRKHFVILNEDGRLIVRDMQSTNGTFYNGRKLTVKTILKPDDYLLAGLSRVKVVSIR